MENINVLKEIAEENNNKIRRIKFNQYAIEKYGLEKTELKEFFNKYNQAVKFYKKEQIIERVAELPGVFVGEVSMVAGGLFGLENYFTNDLTASLACFGFASLGLFVSAYSINKMVESKDEYALKKENPYIEKDSSFDKLAHDYCDFKSYIKENKRKSK